MDSTTATPAPTPNRAETEREESLRFFRGLINGTILGLACWGLLLAAAITITNLAVDAIAAH